MSTWKRMMTLGGALGAFACSAGESSQAGEIGEMSQPLTSTPSEVSERTFVTNGTVHALARNATTLFVGGQFSYIGQRSGPLAMLDGVSGLRDKTWPEFGAGQVHALAADGAGGFYVGGSFSRVGGSPRANLVHLRADRTLDTAFVAHLSAPVHALGLHGGQLWVGGEFPGYLKVLDANTGAVTALSPAASGPVRALSVGATHVIAAESVLQAYDRATAAQLWSTVPLTPGGSPTSASAVLEVAGKVFVSGQFGTIAGQQRESLAVLDASTGALLSPAYPSDPRHGALATDGTTVYASSIRGARAIDVATLELTSFDIAPTLPFVPSDGEVKALAVSGATLYLAGSFRGFAEETRSYLAAVDKSSGAIKTWNPRASHPVSVILSAGRDVIAGGEFTSVNGQPRRNAAAIDLATRRATAWRPQVAGTLAYADGFANVFALHVTDDAVYVGGNFSYVNGAPREGLALVDTTTGAPLGDVFDLARPQGASVLALAAAGPTLYVGGQYDTINGQPRSNLAAIDLAARTVLPFATGAFNKPVSTLAASSAVVYAGGDFASVGGVSRQRFAAFDSASGSLLPLARSFNGSVIDLHLAGGTLYAGGNFTAVGGTARNGFAALNANTGSLTPLAPILPGPVAAIDSSAGTLYLAVSGPGRSLRSLELSTGSVTTWAPETSLYVHDILVTDDALYAAGQYDSTLLGRVAQSGLVKFSDTP